MHFCTATQESDFHERSYKMGTTQPIRNRKELQKFSTYYQTVKPHPRNYALIILGLNTALRISDLLQLQWSDVYDFTRSVSVNICLYWNRKPENKITLHSTKMPRMPYDGIWMPVFHRNVIICFAKTPTGSIPSTVRRHTAL